LKSELAVLCVEQVIDMSEWSSGIVLTPLTFDATEITVGDIAFMLVRREAKDGELILVPDKKSTTTGHVYKVKGLHNWHNMDVIVEGRGVPIKSGSYYVLKPIKGGI